MEEDRRGWSTSLVRSLQNYYDGDVMEDDEAGACEWGECKYVVGFGGESLGEGHH